MQAQSQAYGQPDGVRNVTQLALWVLAWLASLALAGFGPSQLWDSQSFTSWAAIVVNLAVGVGLIAAHARYLQSVDELQRKILLDAMAVTVGVGLVAGCAYGVAVKTDLIGRDADIAYLIMLMGIVYAVASLAGNIRYR